MESGLERAIGKLEGQIAAVQDQMMALSRAVERSRAESSQGRARIYQELEDGRQKASEINAKVEQVSSELKESRPDLADIRRWRERFIGMQIVIGVIATALGGSMVIFWKWIAAKMGM